MHSQAPSEQISPTEPEQTKSRGLLLPVALVAAVAFAVSFNVVFNDFVYDDGAQVVENQWIRDVRYIPDIFTRSVWSFADESIISNYYRPMMHFIYLITYHVFGLRAWGFHLVNLLFHTANAVLVLLLAARIFRDKRDTLFAVPLVAALLFATHPVHSEAIAWVAGLPDMSFTFFYLLALLLYTDSDAHRSFTDRRYTLTLLAFAAATLCKEPALTLPAVLLVYDLGLRPTRLPLAVCIKRQIPFAAVALAYLAIRHHALSGFAPELRHRQLTSYEFLINVFPLFAQHVEKMLAPIDLNAFHVLHPVHSLLELRTLVGLAAVAAVTVAAVYTIRRHRPAFLCLCLFVLPLLPVLYIPALGENTFAERYLYLPSAGFLAIVAALVVRLYDRPRFRLIAAALSGLVLALYSAGTIARNRVWRDDVALFSDTVQKSPDSADTFKSLGRALRVRGRREESIAAYTRAIEIRPADYQAFANRGISYEENGQPAQALADLKSAVRINSTCYGAYAAMGVLYAKQGLAEKAIQALDRAIAINPRRAEPYNDRAFAYSLAGRPEAALADLTKAIDLDRYYATAYLNRAKLLAEHGDPQRAALDFATACRLGEAEGCSASALPAPPGNAGPAQGRDQ